MKKINLKLSFLLLSLTILLSACGKSAEVPSVVTPAVSVQARSVADSREIKQELEYPAIVAASTEAKLIAKSSGTLSGADFTVGQTVSVGQSLAKIDEIGSAGFNAGGVNSNQVKQAIIATEQAQASYLLARSNYDNMLVSSAKDLRQAEIARDQAAKGQSNFDISASESLKSAELAYETAKIAAEQARLTMVNREKQLTQSVGDSRDNADLAASTAANTVSSVLTGINNLAGFDNNNVISISYRANLGALESSSYNQSDNAYQAAKDHYDQYLKQSFSDVDVRIQSVLAMVEKTKLLADAAKYLFDKSIPSSNLPQSSAVGVSLTGLQSAASGYQAQLNALLAQVHGAEQALANVALNNDGTSDTLKQSYELAKKQEASAAQNLNNLKAGNNSQQDQAGFGVNLAQNQYENLQVKINSQIFAAKMQADTAQLQYNNASLSLQSLYDIHSLVSPIAGVVTQKLASNGDTVSAGQIVAIVSQTDSLKIKFFVEAEYILDMKLGKSVQVLSAEGKSYNGLISSVSAQADNATKRFQIEVQLDGEEKPLLGTVVNVKISLSKSVDIGAGSVIVPLSSIEIGQNGNYLFLAENNIAKKVPVELQNVLGEMAQVKFQAADEALIIIGGNKFLHDGDSVEITK
jgi:RND family efflux transporter MFP subunit